MRHLLWIAAAAALTMAPAEPADAAPRGKNAPAAKKAPARKAAAKRAAPKAKAAPVEQTEAPPEGQALRRGERVEFDARLIQGQTAKAGAVYLFERASSDLSSMVDQRKSYRTEIVEEVFPEESEL